MSIDDPWQDAEKPYYTQRGGNAGGRVISEARRIWSHLFIPSPRKIFPNTAASLDYGPEHHELIHGATMSFDSYLR